MKNEQQDLVKKKIATFDENNDQIFDYKEFENMMRSIEPKIQKRLVLQFFKQATQDTATEQIDSDDYNPDSVSV